MTPFCLLRPVETLALNLFLLKLKADAFVGTPYNMTGLAHPVTCNSEYELVWKPQRRANFDGGPRIRDVTNKAGDSTAAEFDGSGLVHTVPWRSARFAHLKPLISIAPPNFR
jgi:hypothetical protein